MSKYRAIRTTVDGHNFASKKEAKRYGELRLLEKAGHISDLELQCRYPLRVGSVTIGHYVCDFRYRTRPADELIVEDVKGMRLPLYKWKQKHMAAQYGIDISEV